MRQIMGGDQAGEVDSGQIMQGLEGSGNKLRCILRALQ